MVGIVAVTRFCTSGSKAFSEYINYIDRDNATRKDKMDQYYLFEEYLGYMENEEKTVVDDYKNNTTEIKAKIAGSHCFNKMLLLDL